MRPAATSSSLVLALKVAATFVALDIAISAIVFGLGPTYLPADWPFDLWTALHRPAFAVADFVLPQPSDFHAHIPLTSWLGLALVYLAQPALLGAALGCIAAGWRKRMVVRFKGDHAL